MTKDPVFVQRKIDTHYMKSVIEAFTVVIDATALPSVNRPKLMVIVHSRQTSNGDDGELPAFVVETH